MSAIEPPSLWPTSSGSGASSCASTSGRTSSASSWKNAGVRGRAAARSARARSARTRAPGGRWRRAAPAGSRATGRPTRAPRAAGRARRSAGSPGSSTASSRRPATVTSRVLTTTRRRLGAGVPRRAIGSPHDRPARALGAVRGEARLRGPAHLRRRAVHPGPGGARGLRCGDRRRTDGRPRLGPPRRAARAARDPVGELPAGSAPGGPGRRLQRTAGAWTSATRR